jgi:hypothetical protein
MYMASLLSPLSQLIHTTASTLIDNQVTTRLSASVGELVTTGFKVVEEVLKVAQDLTAPAPAQPSQPEQGDQP